MLINLLFFTVDMIKQQNYSHCRNIFHGSLRTPQETKQFLLKKVWLQWRIKQCSAQLACNILVQVIPFHWENVFEKQASCHPIVLEVNKFLAQLVKDADIL